MAYDKYILWSVPTTPSTLGKNSGGRSMCISNLGWFGSSAEKKGNGEIAGKILQFHDLVESESFIPGIWEQIWNVL